jgi:hypothetical protein
MIGFQLPSQHSDFYRSEDALNEGFEIRSPKPKSGLKSTHETLIYNTCANH